MRILKEFGPGAVIGTGGYVCSPVLLAAHFLGIRTFIHESNSVPGKIKMSKAVYDRVKDMDLWFHGPIEFDIKGKGIMETYDLVPGEKK